MIGQRIAHYRILDKLGEGGMGQVFLAEDTRLDRRVALKVLPEALAGEPERLARFEREARTLATLNHPNIVTVYSVEQSGALRFLTTELVEGRDLDRVIPVDGLPPERFLAIALPLTDALSAAHAKGIVHRDLKPANVMVTDSGWVKVLDFGLAKVPHAPSGGDWQERETLELTGGARLIGTLPYMSPEQLEGRDADIRSDIFSLGVVLYQMATGEHPFAGRSWAGLVSSILRDQPPPAGAANPAYAGQLDELIRRCLEKDPERRFQSAAEVRHALQTAASDAPPAPTAGPPSVAVLPFADMSAAKDQDYFCEGLAEELIYSLSAIPHLRVASRTSAFRFRDAVQDVREIGRRLGVGTVVEGSLRKSEDRLRIAVRLIDVADGCQLWSGRWDRRLDDVFAVQDEISRNVVRALRVTLSTDQAGGRQRRPPRSFRAYDLYLRGRQLLYRDDKRNLRAARQMFQSAVERDSRFSLAYAGLADCCSYLFMHVDSSPSNLDEARAASRKALAVDPESAEAHASLGLALSLSGQSEEAETAFRRAIELDPGLFEAHYFRARSLFSAGRLEQAALSFERAAAASPGDFQAPILAAQAYRDSGDKARARAAYRNGLEIVERHLELHPDDVRALYLGAGALLHLGQRQAALEWTDRALEMAPEDPVDLYGVACNYATAGETERSLDCLERAVDAGFTHRDWIENDGDLEPLRAEPRFRALLNRLAAAG